MEAHKVKEKSHFSSLSPLSSGKLSLYLGAVLLIIFPSSLWISVSRGPRKKLVLEFLANNGKYFKMSLPFPYVFIMLRKRPQLDVHW